MTQFLVPTSTKQWGYSLLLKEPLMQLKPMTDKIYKAGTLAIAPNHFVHFIITAKTDFQKHNHLEQLQDH